MPTNVRFRALAAGVNHALAIDTDGAVWAWGDDARGQLGTGSGPLTANAPTAVTLEAGVVISSVDAEGNFSVALDTDGVIWTWGANDDGQLGIGSLVDAATPARVAMPNGVTFTAVAAGARHVVALDQNGALWAWGENFEGQIGNGDGAGGAVAVPVRALAPGGVRFISVAAANLHSLAIDEDGNVYTWGSNSEGQLGHGTGVPRAVPSFIGWSLER